MARPITTKEAQYMIARHHDYIVRLEAAAALDYTMEIKEASDMLVGQETWKTLQGIPVEELNRDKRGIRVRTLRESQYRTVADLIAASVEELEALRGISLDMAYQIKQQAQLYADEVHKGSKIRLNVDDQNSYASRLVTAIFRHKESLSPSETCRELLTTERANVESAIEALNPATSSWKWLWAGKAKKNRAVEAYEYLSAMLSGNYGQRCEAALQLAEYLVYCEDRVAWKDYTENSIQYYGILEEINPGLLGSDDGVYGLPDELTQAIQAEPLYLDGLRCTLRRYQEWGVRYILHQKRVLLGDEMGLGKTVQAIASMVSLFNTGATHCMVICPASVITNWCREIQKFSPLHVVKIHGDSRKQALESWRQDGGVAVTTYETTGFIQWDFQFRCAQIIVDEAHYIKNEDARRTINTRKLCNQADRLLFMTGTALENRVEEMIALIQILQPQIASQVKELAFMSSAPQFREKIAPVYYRRKREDVLTELPDLIEKRDWCTLSEEEEWIYEDAILANRYAEARRVSWNVPDLTTSSKAARLLEIVENAEANGRKVIVFSFFLDTICRIGEYLGDRCMPPINGSIPPQRRQEIIDEFDKAPAGAVLLAQILAGGTGLNIQTASVVIICEPQFKPSIENQAISRAYRMGQTRNVLVHRLLCDDTIDERITALLEEKQTIFDAYADESVVAKESLELDEKSWAGIVKEEAARITAKRGGAA